MNRGLSVSRWRGTVVSWIGRSPDQVVVALSAIGLVIRVVWVVFAHRGAAVGDPTEYVYYGLRLSQGEGYDSHPAIFTPWPEVPTAFYAIGYPLFLAALFTLARPFGFDNDARVEEFSAEAAERVYSDAAWIYGFAHAIIGALTIYLVARIARRLLGPRVAVFAALVVAVWPNLVMLTATAHLETLYLFLVVSAVVVLLPTLELDVPIRYRRLVAGGAILGLAAQVRPLVALIVPGLLLAYRFRPQSWRRAIGHAGLVAVTIVGVLLPWTIRNAVVMPDFVLVTTGSGDAACMSRYVGATGHFELFSPGCLNEYPDVPWDVAEVVKNKENTYRARQFILEHPTEEIRLWFWRGFWAFEGDHDARFALEYRSPETGDWVNPIWTDRGRSLADRLADTYWWGVIGLAIIGWSRLRQSASRGGVWLVYAGAFAGFVVPIMLFGDSRYKTPMHPFLAVIAAAGLARIFDRARADLPAQSVPVVVATETR